MTARDDDYGPLDLDLAAMIGDDGARCACGRFVPTEPASDLAVGDDAASEAGKEGVVSDDLRAAVEEALSLSHEILPQTIDDVIAIVREHDARDH